MKLLSTKSIVLVGVSLILLYFSVFPLLMLLVESLHPQHIQNYHLIITQKSYGSALFNTLKLSTLTTLFTLLIGLPLSWLLHKTDLPFKSLFRSLFSIPYIIPPYIGAIAWIKLLNPTSGSLNLVFKGWLNLTNSPFNIYSMWGAVWVLSLFFYNFVFLSCLSALEKSDPSLEEASLMSGANKFQTFRSITLPLLTPALAAGMILVFIATASTFGVPALLLMPTRIFVLTTKIYNDVIGYSGGIARAAALSVILMSISFIGLWLHSLFLKGKRFTTITGKYYHSSLISLKKWKWILFAMLILVWLLIVFTPLFTVFISSLLKIYGEPITFSNLSLAKYQYLLFKHADTYRAFLNSLLFATLASTMAVSLGAIIAYLKVKTDIRGKNWIDFLATLPYAVPGVVVAMGFIMAFSGSKGLNLYNTMWMLIAAYTVKNISFAIRNTAAQLEQIDNSLEEAGQMSGASWLTIFRTILLPILKPTLTASWFLIFMPTFSDLTMSIFLVGPQTETIGTLLFNLQGYDDPQSAAVLATLIVLVILTSNIMLKKMSKGKYGV